MSSLNRSALPTNAPIQQQSTTGRPILKAPRPRAASAQATSFLRRRKVVKILASQAEGTYVQPQANAAIQTFEDYPILDVSDDGAEDTGDFNPGMSLLQNDLASPEHDECLTNEYWAIQGAVNGGLMMQLPWTEQSRVHSMDL